MTDIDHAWMRVECRNVEAQFSRIHYGEKLRHSEFVLTFRDTVERERKLARAYLDLIERVLPKLRLPHEVPCVHGYTSEPLRSDVNPQPDDPCTCGASAHNAIIDEVMG